MKALTFLFLLASAGLAQEPLEPANMRVSFALHGGGNVTLPVARAFRKLVGRTDIALKIYDQSEAEPEIWLKAGFMPVKTIGEADAVWQTESPDKEIANFVGLICYSGVAICRAPLPNAGAALAGTEIPELTLTLPLIYRLPPGSALFFNGRTIVAGGEKPVEVFGTKNSKRVISPGRKADHFALVRTSIALISDPDYPPKIVSKPRLDKGKLILIGGGASPGEAIQEFIDSAGGKNAHIVIVPTAESDFPGDQSRFVKVLRDRGAGKVSVLHARTLVEADSEDFASHFEKATGIWFGGGRQWRLVDRYANTRTHQAMRDLLARGGVIAGSSAGATICGDYLVRGDPLGSQTMMASGYERALAFLPGVGIDQHFTQRQRFPDMIAFKQRYPQLFGIGIDEATAIVVEGDLLRAVGRGTVHLYPNRDPENRVDLSKHRVFSFSTGKVLPLPAVDPFTK